MSKAFLFFCTLLALFISTSGLFSLRSLNDLPPHLAFLPVTLYLTFTSLKQLTKTRIAPEVRLSGNKMELVFIFFIFVGLISLGLKSVKSSGQSSLPPESLQPIILPTLPTATPQPTASPAATLTIIHDDLGALVNIRSSPSTSSSLIEKVKVGNVYPFNRFEDGWYEIQLTSTSSGWLFGRYASPSAEMP